MKILWTTNMPIMSAAEALGTSIGGFGGWMEQAYVELKCQKDIELVVLTSWAVKEAVVKREERVTYYVIPGGAAVDKFNHRSKKNLSAIKKILSVEQPDIIHFWGTESRLADAVCRVSSEIPKVVFIQGMIKSVVEHYYEASSKSKLSRAVTFHDILKGKTVGKIEKKFAKKTKTEKNVLQSSNNIICDNDWCEAMCKSINPDLRVYKQNLLIDEVFSSGQWNENNSHRIFCASQYAPFKGFEVLLLAVSYLKEKYPDIEIAVPGGWRNPPKSLVAKLKYDGYSNYINRLIKKLGLKDNVKNLGSLSREEMARYMSESEIFVQCSTVENHSSTMREAMFLGMPCVVSNCGCISEYVINNCNGFLYRNNEPAVLAFYIDKLFADAELKRRLAASAKSFIQKKYAENTNFTTLEIYSSILKRIGE